MRKNIGSAANVVGIRHTAMIFYRATTGMRLENHGRRSESVVQGHLLVLMERRHRRQELLLFYGLGKQHELDR